jgi:hypothetical protein
LVAELGRNGKEALRMYSCTGKGRTEEEQAGSVIWEVSASMEQEKTEGERKREKMIPSRGRMNVFL